MPKPKLRKSGCPRCGGDNINFRRESMGSRSKSTSYRITKGVRTRSGGSTTSYRTVGLCQDCGYAWSAGSMGKSGKPWWLWLLFICIWPIPLSIWFWKTDKVHLDNKVKGGIIGGFWAILILLSAVSGGSSNAQTDTKEAPPVIESTVQQVDVTTPIDNVVETEPVEDIVRTMPEVVEEEESEEAVQEEVTEEPESSTYSAYATDTVKLRQQPNTDCEVLGKAQPGNEVTVLGTEGDWTHVSFNGVEGYIKSEYLSEEKPNAQLAQVESNTVATTDPIQNVEPAVIADPIQNVAPAAFEVATIDNSQTVPDTRSVEHSGVTVPQPETGDNLVWIPTNGGTKYHRKSTCSKMIDPIQVTKETAIANGFDACGRCY